MVERWNSKESALHFVAGYMYYLQYEVLLWPLLFICAIYSAQAGEMGTCFLPTLQMKILRLYEMEPVAQEASKEIPSGHTHTLPHT